VNIKITRKTTQVNTSIALPSSKSESNRALIINALAGNTCSIQNISTARDTVTMKRLLSSTDSVLDVLDAGTTMRFLTAYHAIGNEEKIITGSERMCERPIKLLVEALNSIGANITYEKEIGYPPIKIKPFTGQTSNKITIRGDVSSQYISALCMIAPKLPLGLEIELIGEIGSRPYILMTLEMLHDFGIKYSFDKNIIIIKNQDFKANTFFVESDWSGASYWFSVAALATKAEIELIGLKKKSLQADAKIVDFVSPLGVETTFLENKIVLKKNSETKLSKLEIDFTDCPDIAQTMAVIAGALGIELTMTGVESLKIKETDRISALQTELAKFDVTLKDNGDFSYTINGKANVNNQFVNTYKDHRMAMAFAPLALLGNIEIENKRVVDKSYPSFWEDFELAGFEIQNL
jgi:3-phosphoshikimate 1-carboxyvinyltransferase